MGGTFLDIAGQLTTPSIAPKIYQRITMNLKVAMNFAVSIGNYPASQRPLCQMVLDLIEQVYRLHDRWIYGLTLRQLD